MGTAIKLQARLSPLVLDLAEYGYGCQTCEINSPAL